MVRKFIRGEKVAVSTGAAGYLAIAGENESGCSPAELREVWKTFYNGRMLAAASQAANASNSKPAGRFLD